MYSVIILKKGDCGHYSHLKYTYETFDDEKIPKQILNGNWRGA